MSKTPTLTLQPGEVTLAELRRITSAKSAALDARAHAPIEAARAVIAASRPRRGGLRHQHRLRQARADAHRRTSGWPSCSATSCCRTAPASGEPLADGVVRLVLATKAVSLARGHSGVRPRDRRCAARAVPMPDVLPRIPSKGSVGASGDLAPLAHLACVLIGEGEVTRPTASVMAAPRPCAASASRPSCSGPKEGLALLNGTQVSTALALAGAVRRRERVRRRRWWRARCRSKRSRARCSPSTRASTRRAASRGRSPSPARCARCSTAARSSRRTPTAAACRTRIRSAACRR